MQTFFTTDIFEAAKFIKKGGIVAFPTETVYGLGANVFDKNAVDKIFIAKKRPNDNPLIAHIANLNQLNLLVSNINYPAQKFIDAFFPSALTLVLPKQKNVPLNATANLQTIGVRMPNHKLAHEFLEACETPIVAPSANLSGKPSPTNWQAVAEDLNGRIDCILQGETTQIGLESTVVDCSSEIPFVLRAGAVTVEQLREVVPETQIYKANKNDVAKSPGLKHRHYSPSASVILISDFKIPNGEFSAFIGLHKPQIDFNFVKICHSVEEYAHELFAFFRECDQEHIQTIYCEKIEEKGLGLALMDRIRRATQK